jgi:hypothetical protein
MEGSQAGRGNSFALPPLVFNGVDLEHQSSLFPLGGNMSRNRLLSTCRCRGTDRCIAPSSSRLGRMVRIMPASGDLSRLTPGSLDGQLAAEELAVAHHRCAHADEAQGLPEGELVGSRHRAAKILLQPLARADGPEAVTPDEARGKKRCDGASGIRPRAGYSIVMLPSVTLQHGCSFPL